MITAAQIRSARAALRWSVDTLAARSGVSVRTLKRWEQEHGVPNGRATAIETVRQTFEASGIEFVGAPNDGPGIRLRRPPPEA